MSGPNRSAISATDFGPWICTGETSISLISTSNRRPTLTPCSQNIRSESDRLNQYSSSATRSRTGSLRMPPASLHRIT